MTTLSLRLPDSLHRMVKQLAEADHVSINQFVATAVAEKASALATEEYLSTRAARGSRSAYELVLSKVPKAAPSKADVLPAGYKPKPSRRTATGAGY
ncbi:MAG: toxin-antitoxin system HicB family antitoxin [Pseudomonadota bacterium]